MIVIKKLVTMLMLSILLFMTNVQATNNMLPKITRTKRFNMYLGAFGGMTLPNYTVTALYSNFLTIEERQKFDETYTPTIASGGVDLGMLIYFFEKYSIGIEYDFITHGKTGDKGFLQTNDGVPDTTALSIEQHLQLGNSNQVFLVLGVQPTERAHLYFKTGISFLNVKSQLSTFSLRNGATQTLKFGEENRDIIGPVFAFQFSYDLSTFASAFIKYIYGTYGIQSLPNIEQIFPGLPIVPDALTERTFTLRTNSVQIGLDFYLYST